MKVHDLKSRPEFFTRIYDGSRTFDIRKNDRDFQVGDILILKEHNTITYTGYTLRKRVTNILRHMPGAGCAAEFGLAPGYVIMSLEDE